LSRFILTALAVLWPGGAWAATGAGPSDSLFIAQIVLLLAVGRGLGEVMQRIGQPAIMGQLLAGILLGPSVLGALAPGWQAALFPPGAQQVMLAGVSQLGILLLLLLTGMETDLGLMLRLRRAAASISVAGIAVPFACGFALGELLPESMIPIPEQRLVTSLFLGTALSISSVKIVAAVVREMDFLRRAIGQLIVAAAIIDDTIGWIIIAVIFGLALHGTVDLMAVAGSVLGAVAFLAVSLTLGQRLVSFAIRWANDRFVSELPVITVILVIAGAMALASEAIGVHTVLGAFVAGLLVGRSPILTHHVRDQLRGAIVALFMPVFFGLAGLGADLTVLVDPMLLAAAAGLVLIASIGKFGGAFLGGRLAGLSRAESLALGCGMNARGSTEVIIATIGLSIGALDQTLYTMIVAMAFITTMAMPPSLRWALARLPVRPEEEARLAREAVEARGFVGNLERLLVAADASPNGRFAARLAGILSAWRRVPTTVLALSAPAGEAVGEVAREAAAATPTETDAPPDVTTAKPQAAAAEAVAVEARKGYGLLLVGLQRMLGRDGAFTPEVAAVAARFDGKLGLAAARGPHARDPVGSGLRILVPVTGTQESTRALEVALVLARAGTLPVTLLRVVAHPPGRRRRIAAWALPGAGVLREAVDLAELFGVPAQTELRRGDGVAEAILAAVREGGHDLVVLGVRARGGPGLEFGAVVDELLARSPASLLLVG
jgi:Kef-type K+ transport system membrane component KefB/nucleotide-binding universal stress UspA family protein